MGHTVTIAQSVHAPSQARSSLEDRYCESIDRALLDDVVLLTSELVTNAVRHSGCPEGDPLTIQATVASDVLRVEVVDRGPGVHDLGARSMSPPSGLGFVDLLSDRWSSRIGESFHVWFEIDVVTRTMLYRAAV